MRSRSLWHRILGGGYGIIQVYYGTPIRSRPISVQKPSSTNERLAGGCVFFRFISQPVGPEYNQLFNLFLACETAAEDLGERGKYLLHCWIVRTATYASSRHFDRCVTACHLVPSRVTCRLLSHFLVDNCLELSRYFAISRALLRLPLFCQRSSEVFLPPYCLGRHSFSCECSVAFVDD